MSVAVMFGVYLETGIDPDIERDIFGRFIEDTGLLEGILVDLYSANCILLQFSIWLLGRPAQKDRTPLRH
jgi:hypothetical protein